MKSQALKNWQSLTGLLATAIVGLAACAGCATSPTVQTSGADTGSRISVVAAEDLWGSIASQLGGEHVSVTSILTNPDADPHDYEPTTSDGRSIASANYVIVNGLDYDPWATKLLDASPNPQRTVLDIGDVVGIPGGGNPHRWNSPDDVFTVIEQITADYKKIDPSNADYFDRQQQSFKTEKLAHYTQLVSDIKTKYSGTAVGATESLVVPLIDGLGLTMLTPVGFLDAIHNGSDPTLADKSTIDNQIQSKQVAIYLYDEQNSTPDVQRQVDAAIAAGIPVVPVTETISPAGANFQDWQSSQLEAIETALSASTGR